jgi:hypothetical protein
VNNPARTQLAVATSATCIWMTWGCTRSSKAACWNASPRSVLRSSRIAFLTTKIGLSSFALGTKRPLLNRRSDNRDLFYALFVSPPLAIERTWVPHVPIMALAARHAFDSETRSSSGGQSVLGARSADVQWSFFPERVSDGIVPVSGYSPPTSLSHRLTTIKYT